MTSRRDFLQQGAAALVASSLPLPARALPGIARARRSPAAPLVDLSRPPDAIVAQTASGLERLGPSAVGGRWGSAHVEVTLAPVEQATRVALAASVGVARVTLRWNADLSPVRLMLGDAWERGYGDLEWRGFVPDRVMPWYVLAFDGARTDGYGVRTGAAAFCWWQMDPEGLTLQADVRSGGVPVTLGARTLNMCELVYWASEDGESPFAALRAFCGVMCPAPRLPSGPVYGHNDWYYAYGGNSAETMRADAAHIVELSPTGGNRPFVVIDDGWQPGRGASKAGAGYWDRGNEKFPDIPGLLADVTRLGARPGVWMRPLQAPDDAPESWRLPREHGVLDPTVEGARQKIAADVGRLAQWGFELVKHDYSTWDLFGRWGFQMGSSLTKDGWTFAEGPRRTSAEVVNALYATIRAAAGSAIVIGCNTVSHLSAGQFEMCRVGDDTSGEEWARTRKMGVNSLAFRAAQSGAFYVADPDCAAVTAKEPWALASAWLDLVARSGTMCFVSLAPDALGAEQKRAVRAALAAAAEAQPLAQALDWQRCTVPSRWMLMGEETRYDWKFAEG
ncbi:MAG: alpha-galactosidase [Gemmatimonadota bacterium]|nr:alpha-galactosidase [Gemmatimonadota bacterium]